jgi:hypothetical protein
MIDFFDDEPDTGIADDGIQRADDQPDETDGTLPPVERELGFILDEPDQEKVAKHVNHLREDQAPARSRHRALWKRNAWWREGRRYIRLDKKENQNAWVAKLPYGMASAPPTPNKVDRLCRRLGNTMLVDKPYPDCEPGDDSNEARDAAEFATRYLAVKGSPSELNMSRVCRSAADKAMTYGSAFGWITMDPTAGGHRPRRMLAHPLATTTENALQDPTAGDQTGDPSLAGVPLQANEDDLQERFVRPDGYLTDDPSDADLQWLPSPKIRLITGLQFTFLPETARGMSDALGCIITDVTTLGDLKTLFPERMAELTVDQLAEVCEWRPPHVEDVLPPFSKVPDDQKYEDGPRQGQFKDAQMVVTSTVYYKSCAEYPLGCYAVIGGDTTVLHRQTWTAKMPAPLNAQGQPQPPIQEVLEIPVAQCRCLDDDVYDDPYGIGIAQELGAADEISASALGYEHEYMFRAGNPIPFIPIGSVVQPKQFQLRDGTPVMVNPNGKPEWENIPPLSPSIPKLREEMLRDQDDAIGLQQAAQGVEDPSVQSGIHAQVIVQEALKAVSNMKDNIGDFYMACCRIILQQARAYCTVPQMISYVGDDGAYKEREWSRADFRTTRRVSIAKGSFTMHTLAAKQQMANDMKREQAIDNEDYLELMAGGVSPVLGIQDNPHLMRVRRQIELFLSGPTPEFTQALQAQQEAAQQEAAQQAAAEQAAMAQQAAAMGSPVPPGVGAPGASPQPAAPPAPLPTPFSRRLPVDLEPMPAKIRHRQLARAMATGKYETLCESAPEWCAAFQSEYAEMLNAAGIMTVPAVQAAKAAEAANQPPALPHGVTLSGKVDASNIAETEQAALAGMHGGAPTAPPGQPEPPTGVPG